MRLASVVFKNLSRRPTRTALTVCGLAIAVASVISLLGVSQGFTHAFAALYNERGVHLVVQQAGSIVKAYSDLPEQLGDEIRREPGVDRVMVGLMDVLSFPEKDMNAVLVNGWPPDAGWFGSLKLRSGRLLQEGDTKQIILGETLAKHMQAKVDDQLKLLDETLTVVGIYHSSSHFEDGGAIVLLPQLQKMLNRPGRVTAFLVSVKKPDDGQTVAAIRQKLVEIPKRMKQRLDEGTKSADPAVQKREDEIANLKLAVDFTSDFVEGEPHIKAARSMAWIISTIGLVIGAIGILNTMFMSVYERTREIGTLRAIGWRPRRVVRLIVGESMLLSILALVLGVGAAKLLVWGLTQHRITSGFVNPEIGWQVIGYGMGASLILGLVGALGPAIWGASLLPTEALRRK